MPGALEGIRVVDLTSVGMGPYGTQILGDMGADVVKVEAPDGDPFRDIAPANHPKMGAAFLNLNRNKRSIVLDLKRDDEKQILLDLLSTADVFVSNIRLRSLRKLNLDYGTLSKCNRRLIYCAVCGFSERGPYAGRAAFDDIIQAMSGLTWLQSRNSQNGPQYVNTIIADKVGGMAAASAIGMALFERERSGLGQAIEVPMFELMVSFNLIEHMAGATFCSTDPITGYERVLSPNRRPYATSDGYISVLPYTTAQWCRFFRIAGKPEYADDPSLIDPALRSREIDKWYYLLGEIILQRSTDEWLALLEPADIPVTRILSLDDVVNDKHLDAIGFFRRDIHPTEGELRTMAVPVTFSRTPGDIRRLAPTLNEHREDILDESVLRRKVTADPIAAARMMLATSSDDGNNLPSADPPGANETQLKASERTCAPVASVGMSRSHRQRSTE